jgi:hypothetical protein
VDLDLDVDLADVVFGELLVLDALPERPFEPPLIGGLCCYTAFCDRVDPECPFVCGNGIVEPEFETCDGDCPTSCTAPPPQTCSLALEFGLVGDARICQAFCGPTRLRECADGDNCCPAERFCNYTNDSDCPQPTGELGSFCDTDEACGEPGAFWQCVNGVLPPEAGEGVRVPPGVPGGYCQPQFFVDCPRGSRRVNSSTISLCMLDCEGPEDCEREDFDCYDIDFDGVTECAPVARGVVSMGGTCTQYWECDSGRWAFCSVFGDTCQRNCQIDDTQGAAECPTGWFCPGIELFGCVANCSICAGGDGCCPRNLGCTSANDSDCTQAEGGAGEPCATAADCGTEPEWVCLTGEAFPGGYCTWGAVAAGFSECPTGSHVHYPPQWDINPLEAFEIDAMCARTCQTDADCGRSGYGCMENDGLFDIVSEDGTARAIYRRECMALGTGTARLLEPCTSTADCAGGPNVTCNGGRCQAFCLNREEISPEIPAVVVPCAAPNFCRPFGQECLRPCAARSDCPAGFSCPTGNTPRYCEPL